ncbi:hypothetical protein DWU89_20045 [Parabacteroides acidifaciens]|uniref:Uncharacterized protein n=1 Tax=Parabacteroides acidifaciens TaxID=2290935 RepID=A0A3D8H8Q1_9BACT|nr:hypothetical protein DWU89_20045 [Parabacteroides acidifaciens]
MNYGGNLSPRLTRGRKRTGLVNNSYTACSHAIPRRGAGTGSVILYSGGSWSGIPSSRPNLCL